MNNNPFDHFLKRCGFKLNLIFISTQMVMAILWAGLAVGIGLWVARLCGWKGTPWQLWMVAIGLAGLVAFATGWLRRLNPTAVAGWLDEHLDNQQLFSAALFCLGREEHGPFDRALIENAAQTVSSPLKIEWPWQNLLRKSVLAITGLGIVAFLFSFGVGAHPERNQAALTANLKKQLSDPTESGVNPPRLPIQSPRVMARSLFPYDIRLANQTERALREGNMEALEALLRKAERDWNEKIAKTDDPEEKKRLKKEERQFQNMNQLMQKNTIAQSGSKNRSQFGPEEDEEKSGGGGAGASSEGKQQTSGKNGMVKKSPGQSGSQASDNSYSPEDDAGTPNQQPSNQPGTGRGNQNSNWDKVAARSGSNPALITQRKDSLLMEYLLPGKTAKVPLHQVVPDSRRAAEAALSREGVPTEYENFVRTYFTELSQQINRSKSKEERQ